HEWTRHLRRMIFLGSPHHGSPLERAGYGLERLLGASPYSAPFQRLGRMRSAGITDLRHGRIIEVAGQADHGVYRDSDHRQPLLPGHVELHAIAATRAERADRLAARLIGDGLVPVASALGHHPDPVRHLPIPEQHQRILPATSHIDLLHHPQVLESIEHWLS
ncbi:MAG: alpha/beta hydrolase, partial [Wenzhouxiangella sp.]